MVALGRFQVLEKAINKGTRINERSNELIADWSPNNIRRLIIGHDFAIISFFVTGGKFDKTFEIVDFRGVLKKDMEQLRTEPDSYKSILGVLTAGRVISSIEEIIFCIQDYPRELLQMDVMGIKDLAGKDTTLENRFPRLRHISKAPVFVKDVANFVGKSDSKSTLLLELLQESGVSLFHLVDQHHSDWWKGKSLRKKFYSMDSKVLAQYFVEAIAEGEARLREEELDEIKKDKNSELVEKNVPSILLAISKSFELYQTSHAVFIKVPILSKAEWANVLEQKNMVKGIRKELIKSVDNINQFRRIDFDSICKSMKAAGLSESNVKLIKDFESFVFDNILRNEEQYKRDSNKLSLSESLNTLKNLAVYVVNTEVNIAYLAFAKYLSRNTPEYANFFYERISSSSPSVSYTRPIMAYCNQYLEMGIAKKCMDNIGAIELTVEQFKLPERIVEALSLLNSLKEG